MADISSIQNPRVRQVAQLLEKSRARKSAGLFAAEGLNELRLCQEAGYVIESVFYEEDVITEESLRALTGISDAPCFSVSPAVMAKIAYRQGVKNAVALVKSMPHELESLKLSSQPLILIAESVEKPGNLGALLRSADAAGADAVFICDPATDIYNPNVIRSSVGCVFTVPVVVTDTRKAIDWLQQSGIRIFTTFMDDARSVWEQDLTQACALVVGTESTGLSDEWKITAARNVLIPMFGKVDSLNVSAAASLLMFEAARQRRR